MVLYDERCGIQKRKIMLKATFGAGCFWGVELAFSKINGVVETSVGYAGGDFENPTYEDVCSGETGHAEVVQVLYDPGRVSYKQLLEVFWEVHDPTTLNHQGPDIGTQYRSSIFYHDPGQKKEAELSRQQQDSSGRYKNHIVTEIVEAKSFYKAEEYHQQYLEKRGQASCRIKRT